MSSNSIHPVTSCHARVQHGMCGAALHVGYRLWRAQEGMGKIVAGFLAHARTCLVPLAGHQVSSVQLASMLWEACMGLLVSPAVVYAGHRRDEAGSMCVQVHEEQPAVLNKHIMAFLEQVLGRETCDKG